MALSYSLTEKIEVKAYQMKNKLLESGELAYTQKSGLDHEYKSGEKKYHATQLELTVKNYLRRFADTNIVDLVMIETGSYEKRKTVSKKDFVNYNSKTKGDLYTKDLYNYKVENSEFVREKTLLGGTKLVYVEQGYYIRTRTIEDYNEFKFKY